MFKKIDGHHDDHIDECAVCLSTLEEDELARRLPNSNHVFHMACIDTWLSGQITCPICRSDASPKLVPQDREPPIHSVSELTEVVVVTSEAQCDHNNTHSSKTKTALEKYYKRYLADEGYEQLDGEQASRTADLPELSEITNIRR